jgi:multidrug transporter EmrE-like cation transporter
MTGWVFIILSSACSVLIAHLLKLIEFRKLNTLRVLTVNYFVATAVAFSGSFQTGLPDITSEGSIYVIALAVIIGLFFIANFFVFSKSVFHNGVGISIAAMRISLIIPVLLSVLWYSEKISLIQWTGVLLVFVTLYLLLPGKKELLKKGFNASWLLLILFLFTGIGDSSLKIYEADFSMIISKEQFMGFVFLSSFIIGLALIIIRGEWELTSKELILGVAIGVPNLYTSLFLIEALQLMDGAIAYSAVNLFTVLGGTLLGILRWGDKLSKLQWIGICCTIFAILLLV